MSRTIDTVTISAVEDRRLVLGGAQVARVFPFGTSWNHVRVGIRCSMGGSATIQGSPRLMLGVMVAPTAGLANGPLGYCPHFVGVKTANSAMTYAAGPPANYTLLNTSGLNFVKRVAFTDTTSVVTGASHLTATDATGNFRMLAVDIVKGSPNFTIHVCRPTSVVTAGDLSKEVFTRAMPKQAGSGGMAAYLDIATPQAYTTGSATLAVDEGVNGNLTSLVLAWSHASPTLHVSDIAWTRFS